MVFRDVDGMTYPLECLPSEVVMTSQNKLLFSKLPEPNRSRQVRAFLLTIATSVISAGAVYGLILWAYYSDRFRI